MAVYFGAFIMGVVFLVSVFVDSIRRKRYEWAVPSGLILMALCGVGFAILANSTA